MDDVSGKKTWCVVCVRRSCVHCFSHPHFVFCRSYPHFETGYIPRKGPAIRLELKPQKEGAANEIYVFITSDAETVKKLLLNPQPAQEIEFEKQDNKEIDV